MNKNKLLDDMPYIGQKPYLNDHPLMKNLVAWYPLNDGGGSIARDISLNKNHAIRVGFSNPSNFVKFKDYYLNCDIDNASNTHFYRKSNVYNIYDTFSHSGHINLTLTCWLRRLRYTGTPLTLNFPVVFSVGDRITSSTSVSMYYKQNSNLLGIYKEVFFATQNIEGTPLINLKDSFEWSFCAITVKQKKGGGSPAFSRLYNEGVLIAQTTVGGWFINDFNTITIMGISSSSTPTTKRGTGQIMNARIYNRILDESELKELYLNPWAPFTFYNKSTVYFSTVPAARFARAFPLFVD